MKTEVIVYIHGIAPHAVASDHKGDYELLHQGIASRIAKGSEWHDARLCKAEWGWNYDNKKSADSHRVLSVAQQALAERVMEAVGKTRDFTINPVRRWLTPMRRMMLYGVADMFYYVSNDGKAAIRTAVSEQIAQCVDTLLDEKDAEISLTMIGHSAGSAIALDLAFYLFRKGKYPFVDEQTAPPETVKVLEKLRRLADRDRLRLRRLITFGSPISMLAFRNDRVVERLAAGGKLDPVNFGLKENLRFHKLQGPRWINLWDLDDPIALPVEPLMDNRDQLVKDVAVDISDRMKTVHSAYWGSSKVHEIIADHW